MIIVVCICIALLSIIFLIAWFFNTIEVAQREIDKNDTE